MAGHLCACDLEAVREIIPARAATRLPGAPEWVSGLINLRGTLLTVVDLAVRFGSLDGAGAGNSIIVAEGAGKVFGIGVDAVRDVQAVDGGTLQDVDAQRAYDGIVRGVLYVGVSSAEAALVVDVAELARQALVV